MQNTFFSLHFILEKVDDTSEISRKSPYVVSNESYNNIIKKEKILQFYFTNDDR